MTVWKKSFFVALAIGAALLPKIICPFCWPLYASALSALGVGFIPSTAYLFPLTATFLFVAVGALGLGAKRRRGIGPLIVSLIGAAFTMSGKFWMESEILVFGGAGILLAAAVWNAWPRKASTHLPCPACSPDSGRMNQESVSEVQL